MCITKAIASKLCDIAKTSQINNKHAAAVLINGKPVAYGVNCFRGTSNYHAECDALRCFFNLHNFRCFEKSNYCSLRGFP